MSQEGPSRTATALAAALTLATLAAALQPLQRLLAACQGRLPGALLRTGMLLGTFITN